jgi:hypothetical protein
MKTRTRESPRAEQALILPLIQNLSATACYKQATPDPFVDSPTELKNVWVGAKRRSLVGRFIFLALNLGDRDAGDHEQDCSTTPS